MDKELLKFSSCAYSTQEMIQSSYDFAIECIKNGIEGDFVECGVAAGAQIGAMAFACQKIGVRRTFHLFDSFEGIPLAGPKDAEQPGIGKIQHDVMKPIGQRLVSSGITVHGIENVKNNIQKWELQDQEFIFHKGWFQNSVPNNSIQKIAFLRLDGDLYESTAVCLEHLAHKVSKGGVVVVDDYALIGAKRAVDGFIMGKDINIIRMPYGVGIKDGRAKALIDNTVLTPVYWIVK